MERKRIIRYSDNKIFQYFDMSINKNAEKTHYKMEKQKLIDEIYRAFENVKLDDGVGLWEGQGIDSYADEKTKSELRKKDEKDNWSKISFENLDQCSSSLSFFDALGMRFHLPQFMIYELLEPQSYDYDLLFYFKTLLSDKKLAS